MHYFIFANKDSTVYNDKPNANTGKDEILEIQKGFISSSYEGIVSGSILSRALVQFDLNYISRSIIDGTITNPRFYLNLYLCQIFGQEENTNLYIYALSQSWVQGVGKRFDDTPRHKGVSWIYRDGEASLSWNSAGSDYIASSLITASLFIDENKFQETGNYTYELSDLRADITPIVNEWLFTGSYSNNGLLIKRSDSEEQDGKDYGLIQFYSTDTHTIYNPKLEVAWDDSLINTSSLSQSNADDMFVYAKNLQATYNNRDKVRFKFGCRPKYPARSYTTSNPYAVNWYLPTSSYYSIVDSNTLETIIPFDTGSTKMSCDSEGNYFDLILNSFHPERNYRIKIKVVSGSFQQVFEIPQSFKVIR